MENSRSSPNTVPEGQMGAWAPYYDLIMKVITLGGENALRQMTVDLALVKTGDKVLEVGCGTGSLTLAVQKSVGVSGEVHGIDAAPEMIKIACKKNARAGAAITFQVGQIDKIPYPEAEFDVVICSFMIFHMSHKVRQRGLKEIFRILKADGRLLIVDFISQADLNALQQSIEGAGFAEIAKGERKFAMLLPPVLFISGMAQKA